MMIRKIIQTLILISTLSLSLGIQAKEENKPVQDIPLRPVNVIHHYINQMVKQYHFNKKKLTEVMRQAKYDPKVIHWMNHPFEKKPWDFYRNFFVRKKRITNGVHYWETHKKILDEIQARYGVPPSIITAIIGVESCYGKRSGTYNELDALTTLSFYYPKREKFFRSELTHYLLLTRHEKLNPLMLKGSYAGALGIPQFMPSSYRHYGIDYSKNKSINLFTNHADAIASIANYLKKAGWVTGKPVAVPAIVSKKIPKGLISKNGNPKYTLKQFRRHHILPAKKESPNLKAALIVMNNTDSNEYWLVFRNFRAIMKYNPRTTYALAVYELSRAIKKAYEQQLTKSA